MKRSPDDGAACGEPSFTEETAPAVRRVIARRMLESKLTTPHFYLFDEVDMDAAVDFRRELNLRQEEGGGSGDTRGGGKISFGDIIVKAAAVALENHPECNVSYHEGKIRTYGEININVAVAVEGALLVPTVRRCAGRSIFSLSAAIRELAEKARNKKLRARENMGGTFTVSNLGVFGLEGSFSIINPPQAFILTTGAIREVPVVRDGVLGAGKRMKVTLSCDHRAVDGAAGALFLADFKNMFLEPETHLLGAPSAEPADD